MSLMLGFDFGTGGVRVGLFDLERRAIIATAERTYETRHPHPGWAEQSAWDWWDALGAACRDTMERAGNPTVSAISLATTASTVVACRADGTPLRPALLWMDCRAGAEAARTAHPHPVMTQSGGSDAAEWLVPKAMWLATHEPDVYAAADVICECLDWLNFRLTGAWAGSRMNATCKWNYDGKERRFHPELYEAFGAPGLGRRLPARIIPVGAPIERLSAAAAAHLGLGTQRPVVAQGGIDAHIGLLGADTMDPGKLLMIGGTSVVHLFHLADERPLPGFWGPYPHALVDGLWLVEAGQVSAGSVLSWLSNTIFQLDIGGTHRLIEAASQLPPTNSGLLTLDYFMGNRTPYRDPLLRGAILGLSLGHDRPALYRSAVDGVALASANVVARARELDVPIERIVSAGGYAKNPLWLRATVDAIGLPVQMAAEENLTIVGTAAAAATSIGLFPDLREAAAAVARDGSLIEPDPSMHAHFAEELHRYREATDRLRPLLHELARQETRAAGPLPVQQREKDTLDARAY
ncbi:FGGY-family carbohydrate kinase [Acetobacteraceae bacterium KSS8]|uniref:FGGY-family carbohydrate kinase n=1 Tax=Endosaccharibacter trunci TaxID=2812733 RepID=A0ABT1W7D7_9PROT|nr:FGGY-family carbohydrate kinase [Acetobacteraceae bacterium KSS8]